MLDLLMTYNARKGKKFGMFLHLLAVSKVTKAIKDITAYGTMNTIYDDNSTPAFQFSNISD